MRLQGGVVANNSDVRERPTQLASRSLPGEACSGYLTCWTAQAQAWLIPESDAGLVQVQPYDWAARRYLAQQEMEPLPHGCCLREQKIDQNRFRFCTPLPNCKRSHGPQNGGRPADPKTQRMGEPPPLLSVTLRTGLGLHRRRWQEILGRQAAEVQIPALSKSLHPFLRRSAAGRTPRGSAPLLAAVVIYG